MNEFDNYNQSCSMCGNCGNNCGCNKPRCPKCGCSTSKIIAAASKNRAANTTIATSKTTATAAARKCNVAIFVRAFAACSAVVADVRRIGLLLPHSC